MAFDGTDPCWIPRVPVRESPKWRLQIAQFGDGYQQRTLDGINALDRIFDLTWQTLPQSELLAMDSFLSARKGDAFNFQHPVTLVMWSVFCDEWAIDWETRRRPAGGSAEFYGTLSAQFVKANGIALVA